LVRKHSFHSLNTGFVVFINSDLLHLNTGLKLLQLTFLK